VFMIFLLVGCIAGMSWTLIWSLGKSPWLWVGLFLVIIGFLIVWRRRWPGTITTQGEYTVPTKIKAQRTVTVRAQFTGPCIEDLKTEITAQPIAEVSVSRMPDATKSGVKVSLEPTTGETGKEATVEVKLEPATAEMGKAAVDRREFYVAEGESVAFKATLTPASDKVHWSSWNSEDDPKKGLAELQLLAASLLFVGASYGSLGQPA
jgi:predicted membrane metal-binding protein